MAKISKPELIRLQKKLKTDAAIGEQFGITRQAVHQLRRKYGIDSVIAKNEERNSDIISQYNEGTSGTSIAKKYKLSVSQTYRIINDAVGAAKAKAKKPVAKKAAKPAPKAAAKKAPAKKVAKKKK